MPSTRSVDPSINSQLFDEYNRLSALEICFHAEELVQDLLHKCSEFSVHLRNTCSYLLAADQHQFAIRKGKIDEFLKSFENIITRLRVASAIVNERKQSLDQQQQNGNDNMQGTKSDEIKRLQNEVFLLKMLLFN